MKVEKLAVSDLHVLTELFDHNNVKRMISDCTHNIQSGLIDIFVLYDQDVLIGELRVKYECEDECFAKRSIRAYLYAFRVREDFQNKGYGTFLLKTVIDMLKEQGYCEFTVGVEDNNDRANHIYQGLGFNEFLLRKQEEYQGDAYEYNLYLKREVNSRG